MLVGIKITVSPFVWLSWMIVRSDVSNELGLSAQLPFFRPFFSTTEREFGKLFFYEVINLKSEDTTKSRIDINFRISNALLTFVKNPLDSPLYIANFTVSVEILDKDGRSTARKIFSGHRATNDYNETPS